ncbi:hypothetical protein DFH27DRAFT_607628 [Peziza echinospora]|nr:hypothetical protein DFH27DRAFT_607628 [Peziza echinospora]
MGDSTKQPAKKRKAQWTTSYPNMVIGKAEERLASKSIKKRVYRRILEYIQIEGYPTEASAGFKESNVSDLVYSIISPILSDFRRKTGRKLRLEREKEIISIDSETGGMKEFVIIDRISVAEEKFVMIIEGKRGSIGEAMKQILLSLKDAGDNNGGGEVYGFVMTGDIWRMIRYDGAFRMTEKMNTLFDTIDEDRQRWRWYERNKLDAKVGAQTEKLDTKTEMKFSQLLDVTILQLLIQQNTKLDTIGKDVASLKTMTSVLYFVIISGVVGAGGATRSSRRRILHELKKYSTINNKKLLPGTWKHNKLQSFNSIIDFIKQQEAQTIEAVQEMKTDSKRHVQKTST